MRGQNLMASSALVLGLLFLPTAWAVDPATLANKGSGTIAACASCHGPDGAGQSTFPRLAGMNANYLRKQLDDFENGSRANAVMEPIAKALTPEDRVAITAYYAAMPVPGTDTAAAPGPEPDEGDPGARLALRGNWDEGIPACVQCHGPGGMGVGDAFPAIAAQPADYIAAQLRAWQEGTRQNDPIELMRHLSARLSASDIQAVSAWFSQQPASTAGGGQ